LNRKFTYLWTYPKFPKFLYVIYSKGNDHIIDAVRCAMLIREEGNLDPIGEETVSLKPVFTDPVFI
jgi:hypothetical protein